MKKNNSPKKITRIAITHQLILFMIFIVICLVFLLTQVHSISVLVFWFSLFMISWIGCYRLWRASPEENINFISNSLLSSTSPQLLYDCLLPVSIYRINHLQLSQFEIESILFSPSVICIVESFKGSGILNGQEDQYLLEISNLETARSVRRKVRNPILGIRTKYQVFKSLCRLYRLDVKVESAIYFKEVELNLSLSNLEHESYLRGEIELKAFIASFEDSMESVSESELKSPHQLYEILYFLESIRYFDYLRRFYDQLSILQKVSLKCELSADSQTLFSFIISREGTHLQRIKRFSTQNETLLKQGIESLQVKLFSDLEEWAGQQQEVVFLPFNFKALVLSEGFNLKTQMDHWKNHRTIMN